ncbi:hypothetical protein [Paracoccus sp. S3-43]|uniref:hypothetical protein n=1 Tax=Paracoccus sp. S3-43 TaxID=3030011 RepID=UPI0023B19BB8|nr:hypothetical protein [Paracoccus sp. S3-43]WEF25589.1 hypothetical protein PXD02_06645 [Paracoccus sp. S3-43]
MDTPPSDDLPDLSAIRARIYSGEYDAGRWYREALFYDPAHRPALEYQGELFLTLGDLESARANLEMLTLFCPQGCQERDTLAAAIAAYRAGPPPGGS